MWTWMFYITPTANMKHSSPQMAYSPLKYLKAPHIGPYQQEQNSEFDQSKGDVRGPGSGFSP
ncbi:hypothetical protein N7456_011680 [Penicillium angulare]|uniref:Uncharacterized protein n=1 Tax=Penicillium angulare TaxID=116970 RepID=A0A9W9JZX2_9EURO|nr:hypothetical protein N7456_011680 [Penicillium angulare]